MRAATKRLAASAVAAATLGAAVWTYWCTPSLWPEYRQGQALVQAVEAFRQKHGRLPSSHEELDPSITESGPVYYTLQHGGQYTVHFGLPLTVGESYTYDSAVGRWQ